MRRTSAFLVAILATTVLLAPNAAEAETDPPPGQTDVVGGAQSAPGQFPWTAALIRRSAPTRKDGFTCGATVLSPSWALTAGHCLLDNYDQYPDAQFGNYVSRSHFALLTGTTSLAQDGGGQKLNVTAVYPHPYYDPFFNTYDFALLRLANPTPAPAISTIGTTPAEAALDDPGTQQTTVGWGLTSETAPDVPTYQRFVQVPMQSDSTCAGAYPIGRRDEGGFPLEYHASSMVCAGPLEGGQDSCAGDSGGPLAIQAGDGTWRQTGVVSFGFGCALSDNPGVYSRVSSAAAWINGTRRFGPFSFDGSAFVTQQHRDFLYRSPTSSELASWTSRLTTAPPSDLVVELQQSTTWQDRAGGITRLYSAAFLRNPDTTGLAHWVGRRFAGVGPVAIADNFATSSEFVNRYGTLSDGDYITRIYQNVFHRDPDPSGRAYWNAKLTGGTSRGRMLYELSNSNEYRVDTAGPVRVITLHFGLMRQVPSAAELAAELPLRLSTLADSLRSSYRYAARFG